tara:strand:- start:1259 stop:1501 length:243 start_codon:yes stop_codon:yes gene_type:complete
MLATLATSFNFEYLRPTGSVGLLVLITGIIFTGMTLVVFIKVGKDEDSIEDKKRKRLKNEEQIRKIAKLYPKDNKNDENT